MKISVGIYNQAMPYLAMVLLRIGFAGLSLISKFALNKGMSQYVMVVYRLAIATLVLAPFAIVFDRKVRPKMTGSIFLQILLLALLEPCIDQNLYFTGLKYTTSTVASALCNVLPPIVFLLAWVCRLEKVNIRKLHCQAKILGTLTTVGGAMIMTIVKGPILPLPWTEINNQKRSTAFAITNENPLKGALMVIAGCVCWACFIILQTFTLKSYPAKLSLTTLICLMGTVEAAIFALIMEKNNAAAWAIQWNSQLLASVYNGIVCTALVYYIGAVVIQAKGPVFFTAFNPLTMIIVAIISSIIFSEIMYLGRVIGGIAIICGLYLVLWGKTKDQLGSDSDSSSKMAVNVSDIEQISTMSETTTSSNKDLVVLDLKKGGESVKENPK